MSSKGGGKKLRILPSKKTTNRGGGGGQKSPFLRRHSFWTAPKCAQSSKFTLKLRVSCILYIVLFLSVEGGFYEGYVFFLMLQ